VSSRACSLDFVLALVCGVALCAMLAQSAHGQPIITTTTSTTAGTSAGCPPHFETSVTTTTTIGPATILIGENQSQTYFVPAGTQNINTNTHTESFACTTSVPTLSGRALEYQTILLLAAGAIAWRFRRRASGKFGAGRRRPP
jgi:hypothetical protein